MQVDVAGPGVRFDVLGRFGNEQRRDEPADDRQVAPAEAEPNERRTSAAMPRRRPVVSAP